MRLLVILTSTVLCSATLADADEIPRVVMVDRGYDGPQPQLYIGPHLEHEDAWPPSYLWLSVDRLQRERRDWNSASDTSNWLFSMLKLSAIGPAQPDDVLKPQAAKKLGIKNGQRVPAGRMKDVCPGDFWEGEADTLVEAPPKTFGEHVRQAQGGVVGRVTRIEHGFTGFVPALLLVLDVEDSLFVSDFSLSPHVVLPVGGYAHEGDVYCASAKMLNSYIPDEGDRIIVMPLSGPWDRKGGDHGGVETLLEFRNRTWVLRNQSPPEAQNP